MRRAPAVLSATIAGTAGVLAFHPHTPARTATPSAQVAPAGPGSRTATGAAVPTPYGDAQVRVTVRNGKLVAVEAVRLQGNDPRSVRISSYAAPILRQEVLTQQTAAVDAVSGATYTSASYEQSLQSALDKLDFRAPNGSRATLQVP
jgi:uncharacterized protein with FMN-binding domain